MHKAILVSALLPLFAFNATAQGSCSSSSVAAHQEKDIVSTALAAGEFKTLATALQSAKLVGALQGEGPFTVFAPTDAAFAKLPKGTVASLLEPENAAALKTILTYHVVPGKVEAAHVVKLKNAAALNGQRIAINAGDHGVSVAGANVVKTDIQCSNGVIHVIDSVMMPTLNDIVTTAVEAGSFKTLAQALQTAHLVKTLQGDGPFTVFAPTDAAFAKLPEGTLANLLKPAGRDQLTAILTYHVVPGRVYADQLEARHYKTVQGAALDVKLHPNQVRVGSATVVKADIETTNGVIHVIDSVLLPPQ